MLVVVPLPRINCLVLLCAQQFVDCKLILFAFRGARNLAAETSYAHHRVVGARVSLSTQPQSKAGGTSPLANEISVHWERLVAPSAFPVIAPHPMRPHLQPKSLLPCTEPSPVDRLLDGFACLGLPSQLSWEQGLVFSLLSCQRQ